jgi:drug/metabolite transporter (DMT)-like permease
MSLIFNDGIMTIKKKHNLNLVLGICLIIVGMIVIGIAGSYISINPSIVQDYALLGGFITFLVGLILMIFGIIQNHLQRKKSQ